jgi:hypothetical protein
MIVGCHGSGQQHQQPPHSCGSVEWNTVTVVVVFAEADVNFFDRILIASQLNIIRQGGGARCGSANILLTMLHSHIADRRDDWGVPWIRTYSPERARMGTDTDCVHPTIVPLEGVCGGPTTEDATMKLPHIAEGRDDCWVPWIRTTTPTTPSLMWICRMEHGHRRCRVR